MSCNPTYKGKRYNSLEELYKVNGINPQQKQQAQQQYSHAGVPAIQANEVEEQTDDFDEIDVEDILDNDTFDELNDLGMEFKNKFSSVENIDIKISNFYDEYIDGKKEAQESLKAARIGTTLEGFSESFKKSGFTKIEEYLDDQKCHIK